MRTIMPAVIAGAVLLVSCNQPAEFNPEDPEVIAAIDSIIQGTMEGSRDVDADRVLAMAEGEGEFTFITGDLMLTGLETIREDFEDTYAGVASQTQTILQKRIRLL